MSSRVNLNSIKMDGDHAGSPDHILVSDQDEFSFTDGAGNDKAFTFSAWVFVEDPAGGDNGPFITKGKVGGLTEIEYIFKHESGALKFFIYRGGGTGTNHALIRTTNAATIASSTWTHVVATYDGSKTLDGMKLYTNGSLSVSTGEAVGTYTGFTASSQPLIIGKTNNDPPNANQAFEDFIADVCIFNKELTAAEVLEIYNRGKVKNMLNASTYNDLISWWKMGDDRDTAETGGIIDYVSQFNGTLTNGASIVPFPSLPTDRITPVNFRYTSFGRTRQPKNVLGDHQVYIHGGVSGAMPKTDPSLSSDGFKTESQRFLHVRWKAQQSNKDHEIVVFGYSYAFGAWAPLLDTSGTEIKLSTSNAAVDIYKVFEIDGVDKVYFKSTGTHDLLATDLLAAAMSSF